MKTKFLSYFFVLMVSISFSSCQDNDENERKIINQQVYELTIASKKVPGTVYGGCGNTYVSDVYAGKKKQSDDCQKHILSSFHKFF